MHRALAAAAITLSSLAVHAATLSKPVALVPTVFSAAAAPALLTGPSAPAALQTPDEAPLPRLDLSVDLTALRDAVHAGQTGPLPQSAREARYLLVRGLLGNRTSNYFDGNLRRLGSLGLDAVEIPIDTEGRRRADLRAIEEAVRASPKPVVLIGHSRGGVLIHDWYRRASPELKAKITRLILLQPPLHGTLLADKSIASWWGRMKTYWAGKILFGEETFRTTVELTTRVRSRVMAGLPQWTREDLQKVYIMRSVILRIQRHPYYRSSYQYLLRMGAPDNDGRLPADSARVPGARGAVLLDVNHDNAVIQNPGWFKRLRGARPNPDFDTGDFTEALVRLAFR